MAVLVVTVRPRPQVQGRLLGGARHRQLDGLPRHLRAQRDGAVAQPKGVRLGGGQPSLPNRSATAARRTAAWVAWRRTKRTLALHLTCTRTRLCTRLSFPLACLSARILSRHCYSSALPPHSSPPSLPCLPFCLISPSLACSSPRAAPLPVLSWAHRLPGLQACEKQAQTRVAKQRQGKTLALHGVSV